MNMKTNEQMKTNEHPIRYYAYFKDTKKMMLVAMDTKKMVSTARKLNSIYGRRYDCSIAICNDRNTSPMYCFRIYLKNN